MNVKNSPLLLVSGLKAKRVSNCPKNDVDIHWILGSVEGDGLSHVWNPPGPTSGDSQDEDAEQSPCFQRESFSKSGKREELSHAVQFIPSALAVQ